MNIPFFTKVVMAIFFAVVTNNYNLNAAHMEKIRFDTVEEYNAARKPGGSLHGKHIVKIVPCQRKQKGSKEMKEDCHGGKEFDTVSAFATWYNGTPEDDEELKLFVKDGLMSESEGRYRMTFCGGLWAFYEVYSEPVRVPRQKVEADEPAPVVPYIVQAKARATAVAAVQQPTGNIHIENSFNTKHTSYSFFNNLELFNGISLNGGGGRNCLPVRIGQRPPPQVRNCPPPQQVHPCPPPQYAKAGGKRIKIGVANDSSASNASWNIINGKAPVVRESQPRSYSSGSQRTSPNAAYAGGPGQYVYNSNRRPINGGRGSGR